MDIPPELMNPDSGGRPFPRDESYDERKERESVLKRQAHVGDLIRRTHLEKEPLLDKIRALKARINLLKDLQESPIPVTSGYISNILKAELDRKLKLENDTEDWSQDFKEAFASQVTLKEQKEMISLYRELAVLPDPVKEIPKLLKKYQEELDWAGIELVEKEKEAIGNAEWN